MTRRQDPRTLSPHFELPEGVLDFDYEAPELNDGFDDSPEDIVDDTETDDQSEGPEVPGNFTITQVFPVRFGPDGSQLIDLLITVEDEVEEIVQYDVRATKT